MRLIALWQIGGWQSERRVVGSGEANIRGARSSVTNSRVEAEVLLRQVFRQSSRVQEFANERGLLGPNNRQVRCGRCTAGQASSGTRR